MAAPSHLAEDRQSQENRLIESHLPLVKALALKRYVNNKDFVDLDDLIGAGNEGLVLAAKRFDPTLGYRFATYAAWWVQNRMIQRIRDDRWVMKIPDRVYRALFQLWRAVSQLRQELLREPTILEIAIRMDVPVAKVRGLIIWSGQEILSLDMPVGSDGQSTLGDFITDDHRLGRSNRSEEAIRMQELRKEVQHVLYMLSPQERAVLKQRFGLEWDEEPEQLRVDTCPTRKDSLSLNQVGVAMGLSEERIRQIEAKALRKLRHPVRSRKLRPFVRDKER
jgi:RNA polymerase primary sigma factor